MKLAVVGNGRVGLTVFRELQAFREINELVLVGRNAKACYAEAEDYWDAIPLRLDLPGSIQGGGYDMAEGADIIVYCAGPSLTDVMDRLVIVQENMQVVREVFAELDKYAPDAMVIVVSNPLDVIVTAIQKMTKRPAGHVIGTGTLLDTARLIKFVSWAFDCSPRVVRGYVLGEHGNSSVPIMSGLTIMGVPFLEYLKVNCDGVVPITREGLCDDVHDAGFKIFRGKGYTNAGVAAAVARIAFNIVNDLNEVLPVSVVLDGEYGVNGYAMSVPCQIGRNGAVAVKAIPMTEGEKADLDASAHIIESVCRSVGL